jgi:hypothetical protein
MARRFSVARMLVEQVRDRASPSEIAKELKWIVKPWLLMSALEEKPPSGPL